MFWFPWLSYRVFCWLLSSVGLGLLVLCLFGFGLFGVDSLVFGILCGLFRWWVYGCWILRFILCLVVCCGI